MDALATALREIAETKNLLANLIQSSESFDYHAAKATLRELERKLRHLSKVQQEFQELQSLRAPNIHVLDFAKPRRPARKAPRG